MRGRGERGREGERERERGRPGEGEERECNTHEKKALRWLKSLLIFLIIKGLCKIPSSV